MYHSVNHRGNKMNWKQKGNPIYSRKKTNPTFIAIKKVLLKVNEMSSSDVCFCTITRQDINCLGIKFIRLKLFSLSDKINY
ncbi:CLUMA_CG018592, isoform A [Clunio marinus]|uniref:CLUMA_CG018592, isoform A n=1 Tax=Clunio marinus TaxID=568069 RepID=A0A1J1J3A8_9DIPT|nr:CLUMA_CG018592, isoform A [Clunio marinus]